jgi:hypothetical protein
MPVGLRVEEGGRGIKRVSLASRSDGKKESNALPVHRLSLKSERLVHSSHRDAPAVLELVDGKLDLPERPAEALVALNGVESTPNSSFERHLAVLVFRVLDVGEGPRLAVVESDFDTSDSSSSTGVDVTLNGVR